MLKKKYYAVRVGQQIGIFETWRECESSVHAYPSAEFKSFKTKEEAIAYLNNVENLAPTLLFDKESDIPICPPDTLIAFVDGSFNSKKSQYAFGCVIIHPDQTMSEFSGIGDDAEAKVSRNVAGELMGAMTAVKQTEKNKMNNLVIHHDYTGIAKWYTGAWKAESYVAVTYLKFMEKYRKKINISFVKVDAHTGNTLNEKADELAKSALDIS